jgi:hypothetical protein
MFQNLYNVIWMNNNKPAYVPKPLQCNMNEQ